jgi:hypothetical protein
LMAWPETQELKLEAKLQAEVASRDEVGQSESGAREETEGGRMESRIRAASRDIEGIET